MKPIYPLLTVALGATLVFANQPQPIPNDVVNKGEMATKLLMQTLGQNMKKNLKKGGVLQALDFCSQEAYTLTQQVNDNLPNGINVQRTSLQTRSPLNKPTADEQAVLQELQKLQNQDKKLPKYLIKQLDGTTYKFYKPLVINKKVCLQCHGNITNKKLKDAISKRYPEDKAIGYKMGDLRGVVVTTIKK
ncbi:MAG: DUF3365 domain-containing protein [Epsilonproteobacteria bacterium]|nr:DUF3365 domain-containing protein [Campylobacterota bacterium]